jgi:hypothetical protein
MAHEAILALYFINASHQILSLYVYRLIVARQRLFKNFTEETNYTCNNGLIVGSVVFHVVWLLSKEYRRLFIFILVLLLSL